MFMNHEIQYKNLVCKYCFIIKFELKIILNFKRQNVHIIESFFLTFVVLFQNNGLILSKIMHNFPKIVKNKEKTVGLSF